LELIFFSMFFPLSVKVPGRPGLLIEVAASLLRRPPLAKAVNE